MGRVFRILFLVLFSVGGVLAVGGGLALGVVNLVDPDLRMLPHVEHAWTMVMAGFFFMAVLYVAARTAEPAAPEPAAVPAPAPQPAAVEKAPEPPPAPAPVEGAPDAATALQQMRTYISLETWDLALQKAEEILKRFAGSPEADAVSRTINELRWKAEPKPAPTSPVAQAAAREAQMAKKEEARRMLQHVRTYIDLEMWDLARAKAHEIAKVDPESAEAAEAAKILVDIEKRTAPAEPRTIIEP